MDWFERLMTAASQFNLLEMVGPGVTPEHGALGGDQWAFSELRQAFQGLLRSPARAVAHPATTMPGSGMPCAAPWRPCGGVTSTSGWSATARLLRT